MSTATTGALTMRRISVATLATLTSVAAAVALPQVFHLAGSALGVGVALGQTFLPMHLPVLLVGFLAGPTVGLLSGLLAPVVSHLTTGMPMLPILPLMVIELGAYGLVAGLLRSARLNPLAKIILAQVAGRAVRALALVVSVGLLSNETVALSTIWTSIADGLPGLALQWVVIPAVLVAVGRASRREGRLG
ncbi:MAG: ECF transporter S component [Coriobacteriaceae bacterium]|nr:ECF transporter S component [Coriobacteriaceae bacterium]MCI6844938.1 ECF transporter S component [Coriobacteriaceae bacterium]MCI7438205.1 ECF transporter S component [Coriobacteriaceae bacterium]MDD7583679.1 ECF transporter S component [Coriobacteriaceae bacterium]